MHVSKSTEYHPLYFLRKLIVFHNAVDTDRTKIYTIQLKPVYRSVEIFNMKNQEPHEIVMMMQDSNSQIRQLG